MGRNADTENGLPFFPWAITASSIQIDLGVEPAGRHPFIVPDELVLDAQSGDEETGPSHARSMEKVQHRRRQCG